MKKIGIDVDEVLSDTNSAFIRFHNNKYKTNLTSKDFTSYYLRDNLGISFDDEMTRVNEFFESKEYLNITPFPGSVEAIEKLSNNQLYIITSRPEYVAQTTNEWLAKYFKVKFKEVIVTNHSMDGKISKADMCKQYGLDIMIEDNASFANECADAGIKSYLITHPWNINETLSSNVTRVKGWEEIISLLG